jgi:SpoIID/LytB domain protein
VLQRSDPRRPYDLIPSELDQVYAGVASETPTATASVNATAGQVLKFAGAFAQVAYSSCCGGHTEAASDAWGSVTIPYLQGVVCAFCSDSPNYRWTTSIPFDVIATRFAGPLQSFGRLEDLQITERDPSGRARLCARHGPRKRDRVRQRISPWRRSTDAAEFASHERPTRAGQLRFD